MSSESVFEIFGIFPIRLNLSDKELERKFYELSMSLHPDRNPGAEAMATEKSAKLNQAYRALRDPWRRAEAALATGESDLKAAPVPALAAQYFEILESEDAAALQIFKEELKTQISRRTADLISTFQSFDSATTDPERRELLKKIQRMAGEQKYAISLERDVDQKR